MILSILPRGCSTCSFCYKLLIVGGPSEISESMSSITSESLTPGTYELSPLPEVVVSPWLGDRLEVWRSSNTTPFMLVPHNELLLLLLLLFKLLTLYSIWLILCTRLLMHSSLSSIFCFSFKISLLSDFSGLWSSEKGLTAVYPTPLILLCGPEKFELKPLMLISLNFSWETISMLVICLRKTGYSEVWWMLYLFTSFFRWLEFMSL